MDDSVFDLFVCQKLLQKLSMIHDKVSENLFKVQTRQDSSQNLTTPKEPSWPLGLSQQDVLHWDALYNWSPQDPQYL